MLKSLNPGERCAWHPEPVLLAMPAPTAALSSLPLSPAVFPASTLEEMGRKEEDDSSSWKKQTSNIRKTFIFMEALGS